MTAHDAIREKLADFCRRFNHCFWAGPFSVTQPRPLLSVVEDRSGTSVALRGLPGLIELRRRLNQHHW